MPGGKRKKSISKTNLFGEVAAMTGLTKRQVESVFDSLIDIVRREVSKKGGNVNIPGLVKIMRVIRPAVEGGIERPHPFKPGETFVSKEKPACDVIRIRQLRPLRKMV